MEMLPLAHLAPAPNQRGELDALCRGRNMPLPRVVLPPEPAWTVLRGGQKALTRGSLPFATRESFRRDGLRAFE